MAQALSWLVLLWSLRSFLRGVSSLSADCSLDCQSHCLIDCKQGHYYTAGNCLECPAGFYCPGGQAAPRKCPLGTANELTAQGNLSACQVCPHGSLSLESRAGCRPCPQGYSCDPGTGTQRRCEPGQHSPEGELGCRECPEGHGTQPCLAGQQPDPTRTLCVSCAPASLPAEDTRPCQPCPAGHFCPDGLEVPPCPAGSFRPKEGVPRANSSSLSLPELRFNCALLAPSRIAVSRASFSLVGATYVCPAGSASPRAPGNACPPGTAGNRLDLFDKSQCEPCPAGFACATGTGGQQKPPSPCPVGHYCPPGTRGSFRSAPGAEVAADCTPCPGGHHCPELGTVTPRACGAGKFSEPGSASCWPCRVGHFCASENTSLEVMLRAMVCPAGLLCPAGQAGVPDAAANACPQGHFCPQGDAAQPCPNGTYGEQRGLSSAAGCSPCPAGKFCYTDGTEPPGIPHPTGDCPAGYLCPPGTGFPFSFPCMPGSFWDNSSTEGEGICKPSPAGHFCDSPALTEPKPCPAGFYCPEGSSKPEPCPEGTFGDRQGLSGPSGCSPCARGSFCAAPGQTGPSGPCEAGFYCQGRALTPWPTDGVTGAVCPAGSYCPPGSAFPTPCPPGTFSNTSGLRNLQECLDCPPGLYCDGTNNQAPSGPCAPGYFCTGGAKSALQHEVMEGHYSLAGAFKPEPCPLGTFQPGRAQSVCRDCPEGTFCSEPGLPVPQDCPKGHFCLAGSSVPLPCPAVGLPFGDLCPRGHYCPAGTGHPREMPCPAGTWNGQRGAQDVTWCLPCAPGFFCNVSGQDAPGGLCARGYYCTGRTKTAKPEDGVTGDLCPRGHFCPEGSAAPSPCPSGEYSNATGQDKCLPCPAGFHCSKGLRRRCPPGFYCPQKTGISFYPCPPGTYNPSYGLSHAEGCQQCPAGMFCGEWGLSSPSGPCWPGFFCTAAAASAAPQLCPAGTFSSLPGRRALSECQPCPSGFYCEEPGLSAPTGECWEGYFCPQGTALPIACPAGSYNPALSQTSCLPCPEGFFCPKNSSSILEQECPPGHFCPAGTASAAQFPCPKGTFNPQPGSSLRSHCSPCEPGYFCNGTGLVSPTGLCEAGFYCSGGSLSPRPPRASASGGPCPPGHFCEEGSSRAQPCPAGTYSPSWSGTQCLECPEGFYCTSASTNYTDCPQGHYCPRSTEFATQHPCPPGTYSEALNLWDASRCQLCPPGRVCSRPGLARPDGLCTPGWFCPPGSTSSKPMFPGNFSGKAAPAPGSVGLCQAGTFCPAGSSLPLPCPPGWFCASPELAAPSGPCQAGFYCTGGSTIPNPRDGAAGDTCPQGHFCPAGSYSPSPCPPEPRSGSAAPSQAFLKEKLLSAWKFGHSSGAAAWERHPESDRNG
ncbi:multiple epidermal growth factor-like domains protein 6 [Hirundo rustica]|uniref:multiple epidermal growth factor-like domains protein 6 n=1 Tax=Hirundo rustica TaxID=43150 RepID=UPI001A93E4B5|nr:multiple epidermal growth factor-like domains protein 6 [Hirundo rustica]